MTDQDLRCRLAEVIGGGGNEAAADAILDDAGLLDAIAEHRARQINAEVDAIAKAERKPQTWKSVYDIPFNMKFWGIADTLTIEPMWHRFTHDTCQLSGALHVESSRVLDAHYPNGFSEVLE